MTSYGNAADRYGTLFSFYQSIPHPSLLPLSHDAVMLIHLFFSIEWRVAAIASFPSSLGHEAFVKAAFSCLLGGGAAETNERTVL